MSRNSASISRIEPGNINTLAAIAIQLAHLRLRHWWPVLSESLSRARPMHGRLADETSAPVERVLGVLLGYTARRWQHVSDERLAADLASLGFWDARDRQRLAVLDVEAHAARLLAAAIAEHSRATLAR